MGKRLLGNSVPQAIEVFFRDLGFIHVSISDRDCYMVLPFARCSPGRSRSLKIRLIDPFVALVTQSECEDDPDIRHDVLESIRRFDLNEPGSWDELVLYVNKLCGWAGAH